jgi:alcohol dehydrogenase class IV
LRYGTRNDNTNAAASESSTKGLKLLIPSLLQTKRNPADHEARLNSLKGGKESIVFLKYRVAPEGSHGIGHEVGAHGVLHGECTGVMLPSVLKYNAIVNDKQQGELLNILWHDETTAEVLRKWGVKEDIANLGDAVHAIFGELGLPQSLEEVGIATDQFESIAESSLHDFLVKKNSKASHREESSHGNIEIAA